MSQMSKLKKPKDNYTALPLFPIRNKNLNLAARGMWAFLWQLPPGWEFSVKGLMSVTGVGKTAISSALQSLEKYGYLKRIQSATAKGLFGKIDYLLDPEPVTENQHTDNQHTDNQHTDNPPADNSPQLSINVINNKTNKHENIDPAFAKFISDRRGGTYQ